MAIPRRLAAESDASLPIKRYGSFESLPTDEDIEEQSRPHTHTLSKNFSKSRESFAIRSKRRPTISLFDEVSSIIDPEEPDTPASRPYGLRKIEAVVYRIARRDIRSILFGIYLCTTITSLEANCSPLVEPYLLSDFGGHAYLGVVGLVANIAFAMGRPPTAKVLDAFGRAEAVALACVFYCGGFLLMGMSWSTLTFAIAKVLASFGGQGLQLGMQILVADVTTMSDRGLFTASLALPWMATIWVGPLFGQIYLYFGERGYRIAFATFAIAVPALTLPLVFTLRRLFKESQRRLRRSPSSSMSAVNAHTRTDSIQAKTLRDASISSYIPPVVEAQPFSTVFAECTSSLDLIGMALCSAAVLCLLLPLSLAATQSAAWHDVRIYVCFLFGLFFSVVFIRNEQYVLSPFLPGRLLSNSTIKAGCLVGFFHFTCQITYESYFSSFLQVARYCSPRSAQYLNQAYIFTACVSALLGGWASRKYERYKIFGILGILLHMLGAVFMVRFRRLNNPLWELAIAQIIAGFGGGLTTISMQLGVQAVVAHIDVAMATALLLTITQFGAAVGGSIAGAVWTTVLPRQLRKNLDESVHDRIPDIMGSLVVALSFEKGTTERQAINGAYTDTQWILNLIALVALLPALLCMLMMDDVRFNEDLHVKDTVVILGDATPDDSEDER